MAFEAVLESLPASAGHWLLGESIDRISMMTFAGLSTHWSLMSTWSVAWTDIGQQNVGVLKDS